MAKKNSKVPKNWSSDWQTYSGYPDTQLMSSFVSSCQKQINSYISDCKSISQKIEHLKSMRDKTHNSLRTIIHQQKINNKNNDI